MFMHNLLTCIRIYSYYVHVIFYIFYIAFKIYNCDSTATIQFIMNSDIGFEVLEIIGYPGAPSFIKIEEKSNILG